MFCFTILFIRQIVKKRKQLGIAGSLLRYSLAYTPEIVVPIQVSSTKFACPAVPATVVEPEDTCPGGLIISFITFPSCRT